MSPLRWGILSTATIGGTVVDALAGSPRARFVAVASRDAGKAADFAHARGLEHSFGSYEELLRADVVDAVYVPLPISMHAEWSTKALRAGKHVLCEKPLTPTAAEASAIFDTAEAAGRRCVEGLMYRHHPQTTLARRLVADGAVGQLTLVRAALTVSVPAGDIRRVRALGGGAHLDLGCYCVSAIRLFGGEPEHVYATAVPDADGCDLRMAATLGLPGGVLGQLDIGLDLTRRDQLELVGTGGRLVVPDPWICRGAELELWRNGTREAIPVDLAGAGLDAGEDAVYRLELDSVSEAIATGAPLEFGRADAVAQAATLEALRVSSERGAVVTP